MRTPVNRPFVSTSIVTIVVLLAHTSAMAREQHPGKQIFERWCTACHMDSPFAAGTIQLKQIRGADRAVIEQRKDLTEPYLRSLVREGFAGMPKFRRTEISNTELDALIEYLVQP